MSLAHKPKKGQVLHREFLWLHGRAAKGQHSREDEKKWTFSSKCQSIMSPSNHRFQECIKPNKENTQSTITLVTLPIIIAIIVT